MNKIISGFTFFVLSINVHAEMFWQTDMLKTPYIMQETAHETYFIDSLKNKNQDKPIIFIFGRNNCGWTKGLLRQFRNHQEINNYIDNNFNLILINSKTKLGSNLMTKLEHNTNYKIDGVPHIAILEDFTEVDKITGTNISSVPFEAYVEGKGIVYDGEEYYHDADKIMTELKNYHLKLQDSYIKTNEGK